MNSISYYPWLLPAWQRVVDHLKNDSLPHAILFHSPQGFGKHIIANELARLLLCQGDKQNQSACNQCNSCTWFSHQEKVSDQCHPDCYPLASNSDSGIIKIDEIRHLITQLGQTANQSGWKVSIIFQANRLNTQAFNAFLKTLEEPTDKTLFLLLADTLSTIPLTVLSRTQRISLSLNDEACREQAVGWLSQQGDFSKQQIDQALRLSNEAPLLANDFLQDNKMQQYQEWVDDLAKLEIGQMGTIEMAKKWQLLKEENIVWLYRFIHQKLTEDSILANIGDYTPWLLFAQQLKKQEKSWLQNLNDLLVLQMAYSGWLDCYKQQNI